MIDSTFGKVNLRAAFRQTFENERVAYFLIEASASDEVIKARLAARVENPQAISDARLEDFSALSQAYEEMNEIPAERYIRANTEAGPAATLSAVFQKLTRLSFPAVKPTLGGNMSIGRYVW